MDRIRKIETFRWLQEPRIVWVEITTEQGCVGLGESYYGAEAMEAVIHHMIAPLLIGKDPDPIEHYWHTLFACANFSGYGGAEMRALSAVDIALWDIKGQTCGKPIHSLLGGKVRSRIPVYNTCVNSGHYRDMDGFLQQPGQLALDLLNEGISAMKIFPWDRYAPKITVNNSSTAGSMGMPGTRLTPAQLDEGLSVVDAIRKASGKEMTIMIEGHASWDLPTSLRIAKALEPYDIFWMEDMMQPNNPDDLARLAAESRVPQAVSERLLTRFGLRQVLEKRAAHIVMTDIVWTGGITECKKIAALADTYHLPIAPHDCVGPVNVFASLHICANAANALFMETARAFWNKGYYEEVVDETFTVVRGHLDLPDRPGLGTALRADFKARKDVSGRATAL